ncbi:MarR family transcriptional regulator [uncultured Paraglaciecola sp.]|uniref:MarR family winged helix-turn-helix transcriptional regulator n=1 Tax=uncultured Paraglaciecola sp. TaxID=1765024 RepID=UPI0026030F1E|nr:MarR family transcriptional regulator [uncultured Paraglaciecola sp.]
MENRSNDIAVALRLIKKTTTLSKRLDSALGSIHGIGLTEYLVLDTLMSISTRALKRIDIADNLGKSASGITRVLLPMEKTGLITKDIRERDARVSLVKITDSGATIFEDATVTMQQKCSQIFENWSEDDISLVSRLLGKI